MIVERERFVVQYGGLKLSFPRSYDFISYWNFQLDSGYLNDCINIWLGQWSTLSVYSKQHSSAITVLSAIIGQRDESLISDNIKLASDSIVIAGCCHSQNSTIMFPYIYIYTHRSTTGPISLFTWGQYSDQRTVVRLLKSRAMTQINSFTAY